MFSKLFHSVFLFSIFVAGFAQSQTAPSDFSWIQVEAQSSRQAALGRAEFYSQTFDNVAGFETGGRWHGVALGPFDRPTANDQLRQLRAQGRIPRDSFVANGTAYRNQFWPLDGTIATPVVVAPALDEPTVEVTQVEVVEPEPSDETLSQARASERALDRDEKRLLQTAMAWAGSYSGAIDGLFGPGTRRAMADWQSKNNYDDTGVLTSKQRVALLSAYNAVLEGLGLTLISDTRAGVSVQVPSEILGDPTYEAPFVRYEASGDIDAKLIIISQRGDETRMRALYDILQTLAIIPDEGDRKVGCTSFTIEGEDSQRHTSVFAKRIGDEIKGLILVWPRGDEERRRRVKAEIFNSFQEIKGVLPDAVYLDSDVPPVDLLAGLEVRKPRFSQSGLFVNSTGMVLTATTDLGSCGKVVLAEEENAEIVASNDFVTVLKPKNRLAPMDVPVFQKANIVAPYNITVGGFSYGGLLGSPTLTTGHLRAVSDLSGQENIARLSVTTQPGDIGGPVFDSGGAVVGILLPKQERDDQTLPEDVQFAALGAVLDEVFASANVATSETTLSAQMDPVDMSAMARDTAALVTCWD